MGTKINQSTYPNRGRLKSKNMIKAEMLINLCLHFTIPTEISLISRTHLRPSKNNKISCFPEFPVWIPKLGLC